MNGRLRANVINHSLRLARPPDASVRVVSEREARVYLDGLHDAAAARSGVPATRIPVRTMTPELVAPTATVQSTPSDFVAPPVPMPLRDRACVRRMSLLGIATAVLLAASGRRGSAQQQHAAPHPRRLYADSARTPSMAETGRWLAERGPDLAQARFVVMYHLPNGSSQRDSVTVTATAIRLRRCVLQFAYEYAAHGTTDSTANRTRVIVPLADLDLATSGPEEQGGDQDARLPIAATTHWEVALRMRGHRVVVRNLPLDRTGRVAGADDPSEIAALDATDETSAKRLWHALRHAAALCGVRPDPF